MYWKLRIAIYRCYFWLSRDCNPNLLTLISDFFSCREDFGHYMFNSNFWKIAFHPKIKTKRFVKVKLPNMTDWHILRGLKIDVLIACRRLSLSPQKVECVSGYRASGHLHKFAADLTLSTPQNSQPWKLSHYRWTAIKFCVHLHPEFSLCMLMIKISFVLLIQKPVMQHFDLYSRYNRLVTIIFY